MQESKHISVKDSIGAGAGEESAGIITSTLSRNRTSFICSGLRRRTRSEGFHRGTIGSGGDKRLSELRRAALDKAEEEL